MKQRSKNILLCVIMSMLVLGGFLGVWLGESKKYSDSERRFLAKKPTVTMESILSGKFVKEYETFLLDQFPERDNLRFMKAFWQYDVFLKAQNNKYYFARGHISKMDEGLSYKMLDHAVCVFDKINQKYLVPKKIRPYMMIVPDKNYYLAKEAGQLTLDYEKLYDYVRSQTDYMKHIDVRKDLSLKDYYFTDTHWRQECLEGVVATLEKEMGVSFLTAYDKAVVEHPFYGVYYGQAAVKMLPDEIGYLTNEELEACTVTEFDTGMPKEVPMYNEKKAMGKDAYELFLGGAKAVLQIDNPKGNLDKQLVIFRDSFGSSLAPLLVKGYKRVILVDVRYIQSDLVGEFVDFENSDVLFEYNVMLLNSSLGMH